MKYQKNFRKIVYGYIEVTARNPENAQEVADSGEYDEIDNKSEYEFEQWEKVE